LLKSTFPEAKICVLPGQNRLKDRSLFSIFMRVNWVKKVFANQDNIEVLDWSLTVDTSSTYEIYLKLKKQHPSVQILICSGDDVLNTLKQWKHFDKIKSELNWIFLIRKNGEIISKYRSDPELNGLINRAKIMSNQPNPISSTQIRNDFYESLPLIPLSIREDVKLEYSKLNKISKT